MKPSPAFQMYPSDWISSQRVQMLTLEEEGAYIRLICFCWQHGSIPSDPDMCARLIGKGGSTTVARVVQAMFQPHPDDPSILVHDRLDQEREKQTAWREKSSAGGRKSAQMRAEKATSDHVSPTESPKSKGGSRVVDDWCQPNGNTSSSSSSSSSIKEELALPFASPEFSESWNKWIKYRKEIKKQITPTMAESQLKNLAAMGEKRAIAMIENTIIKGWQGLREESEQSFFGSAPKKPKHPSCL